MNVFLETLWFLLLFCYYILEAIVLFFIPSRCRRKDVKGQTVLITGAGSGLGRLMAERFARLGCKLVLWDISSESNNEAAADLRQLDVEVHTYVCDVANSDSVYRTANKVKTEVGRVDILVNNAGVVTGRKVLDCSDALMKKTMDINTLSHFWTVKAFLPEMMSGNHGHIVTMSSAGGLFGVTGLGDYGASKAAALGFHEAVRMELYALNKTGVHMTLVCPFFINTGMFTGVKTRFPWLLPLLEQEDVANEIVDAVLTNQAMLCLPRIINVAVVLKSLLPIKVQMLTSKFVGTGSFMEEFRGRTKRD